MINVHEIYFLRKNNAAGVWTGTFHCEPPKKEVPLPIFRCSIRPEYSSFLIEAFDTILRRHFDNEYDNVC